MATDSHLASEIAIATKSETTCRFLRARLCHLVRETAYFRSQSVFLQRLDEFHRMMLEPRNAAVRERHGISDSRATLNENTLSKFLSGDNTKITAVDFRLVVCFLSSLHVLHPDNQGELIASQFADPLFHTLLHFLKVDHTTLDNIKSVAPGIYQSWRPSTSYPGRFWRGVLKVWVDPDSSAVRIQENYAALNPDGRRSVFIRFDGYLLRKDSQYIMISRNQDLSSLALAIFPLATKFAGQLHMLDGFLIDMTTARLYNSRFVCDLLHSKAEMSDELHQDALLQVDVVPNAKVPDSIRARFEHRAVPYVSLF